MSPGRRLQQLELALDALRARGFTEKHPDVIVTLQEIAEVKESIRQDAARGAPAEGEPKTATQRGALAQQQRAQTRVQTAELEIERLDSTIADLQKQLEASGIEFATKADPATTGPASFVVVDPDGNTILVDQHV